jgi:hypothetical protein
MLTQQGQQKAQMASSAVEPSILYFSLALPLRIMMGIQGMKQLSRQHRIPDSPRRSPLLLIWQQEQKEPQQQFPQLEQQSKVPLFHSLLIFADFI